MKSLVKAVLDCRENELTEAQTAKILKIPELKVCKILMRLNELEYEASQPLTREDYEDTFFMLDYARSKGLNKAY